MQRLWGFGWGVKALKGFSSFRALGVFHFAAHVLNLQS